MEILETKYFGRFGERWSLYYNMSRQETTKKGLVVYGSRFLVCDPFRIEGFRNGLIIKKITRCIILSLFTEVTLFYVDTRKAYLFVVRLRSS